MTIKATGDCAVCVTFPGQICVETNLQVRALQLALEQAQLRGVSEMVPAYCSLMIHYGPLKLSYQELETAVRSFAVHTGNVPLPPGTVTQIPVLYGGEFGPDLEEVAQLEGITAEEVIRRHSAQPGFIYMIAFAPGLPYIGSLEDTFSVPRRTSPGRNCQPVLLPSGNLKPPCSLWISPAAGM